MLVESHRLWLMCALEEKLRRCGYGAIAGIDEAGRGALAGPVMAAAVIVDGTATVPGVDDSKTLDAESRAELAAAIRRAHPHAAVAAVSAADIDRINVLEASRLAMRHALVALTPTPDIALVDAVTLEHPPTPTLAVVRGDQISYAIACASILAKVERDALMTRLDRHYPAYGFASNKGYGAPGHRAALASHGPSPVHRLSFRSVPSTPLEAAG